MANYLKEIENPSLTEMIVTMKFSNQLVLNQTINSLQLLSILLFKFKIIIDGFASLHLDKVSQELLLYKL